MSNSENIRTPLSAFAETRLKLAAELAEIEQRRKDAQSYANHENRNKRQNKLATGQAVTRLSKELSASDPLYRSAVSLQLDNMSISEIAGLADSHPERFDKANRIAVQLAKLHVYLESNEVPIITLRLEARKSPIDQTVEHFPDALHAVFGWIAPGDALKIGAADLTGASMPRHPEAESIDVSLVKATTIFSSPSAARGKFYNKPSIIETDRRSIPILDNGLSGEPTIGLVAYPPETIEISDGLPLLLLGREAVTACVSELPNQDCDQKAAQSIADLYDAYLSAQHNDVAWQGIGYKH